MTRAPNIAPWLSVADPTAAVDYYKAAFGAAELQRDEIEGRVVVGIQDDPDAGPDSHEWRSVRMILTVENPDSVFAGAVAASATVVYRMEDGHGWHIGRIVDPSGHHWEIGKPLAP